MNRQLKGQPQGRSQSQSRGRKTGLWTAGRFAKTGFMKLAIPTVLVAAVITACETPTDNQIEQARQCSNSAASTAYSNLSNSTVLATAAAQASACENQMVSEGLTTSSGATTVAAAGSIQFGLILIEDQLLSNINAAAQSIGKSGGSILSAALPALIANPTTDATRMTGAATSSGDPNLIYVANLISMATTLQGLGLTTSMTPGQVQGVINSCNTNACQTALQGEYNTAVATQCSSGGNSSLCTAANQIAASCAQPCSGTNFTTALGNYVSTH